MAVGVAVIMFVYKLYELNKSSIINAFFTSRK